MLVDGAADKDGNLVALLPKNVAAIVHRCPGFHGVVALQRFHSRTEDRSRFFVNWCNKIRLRLLAAANSQRRHNAQYYASFLHKTVIKLCYSKTGRIEYPQ